MEYIRCPKCKNDVPIMYLFCPYCGLDLRFIIKERLIARLTIRDRLLRMYMLFRDPLRTIEHIASAPDLMGGFIITLLCAMILFCKFVVLFQGHGARLNAIAVGYLLISSITLQIILWISISGIIGLATKMVGGTGSFREILSLVGYCQIYLLPAHILGLSTGVAYVYIPFLIFIAIMTGYGLSYTHLLKKITAILSATISIIVFIVFFYII